MGNFLVLNCLSVTDDGAAANERVNNLNVISNSNVVEYDGILNRDIRANPHISAYAAICNIGGCVLEHTVPVKDTIHN